MEFAGLRTTSWVTDTGEVVREESPLGFDGAREAADAQTMAVPASAGPICSAAAVVPTGRARIDEPRDVRRLRLRLSGADHQSRPICPARAIT